nr:MAG TPA: hypothetical protein [Inoviridae sp.]
MRCLKVNLLASKDMIGAFQKGCIFCCWNGWKLVFNGFNGKK